MGIALYEDGQLRAEVCEDVAGRHAEALLPALDALLRAAGWEPASLAGVAVSIGPGSFTGLRVGLATVKGLCFDEGPRVVPVSTLAGLALQASAPGAVASLLDARRGEVYAAAWAGGPSGAPVLAESVYRAAELAQALPVGATLVVGEGARAVADAVRADRPDLRTGPAGETRARADAIGRLAAAALAAGEGVPAETLVPRYLRRAEAEVQRTGLALER